MVMDQNSNSNWIELSSIIKKPGQVEKIDQRNF